MAFYANFSELLSSKLKLDIDSPFNGVSIQVRALDGFINLSSLGTAIGRKYPNYARTQRSQSLINEFSETLKFNAVQTVKTNHGNVYWGDARIALDFIASVSAELQLQFLNWITLIISGQSVSITTPASTDDVNEALQQQLATMQQELAHKDSIIKQFIQSKRADTGDTRNVVYLLHNPDNKSMCRPGKAEDGRSRWNQHLSSYPYLRLYGFIKTKQNTYLETFIKAGFNLDSIQGKEWVQIPVQTAWESILAILDIAKVMWPNKFNDTEIFDSSHEYVQNYNNQQTMLPQRDIECYTDEKVSSLPAIEPTTNLETLGIQEKEYTMIMEYLNEPVNGGPGKAHICSVLKVVCSVMYCTGLKMCDVLKVTRQELDSFSSGKCALIEADPDFPMRKVLKSVIEQIDLDTIMHSNGGFLTNRETILTVRRCEKYFYPYMLRLHKTVCSHTTAKLRYSTHSFRIGFRQKWYNSLQRKIDPGVSLQLLK